MKEGKWMAIKTVVDHLYTVPLGFVNAFLIDSPRLILIDTGIPGSSRRIINALAELGKRPADIDLILLTHMHSDHVGSLADLQSLTRAQTGMHALDASLARIGETTRPGEPGPGWLNHLQYRLFNLVRGSGHLRPAVIDLELEDGQEVPGADGLCAIHTPGHTAGHLSYFWSKNGGILITGDAATHQGGLGLPFIFEDLNEGRRSLAKLSERAFEVAVFAHGKPIFSGASQMFREKWGKVSIRNRVAS